MQIPVDFENGGTCIYWMQLLNSAYPLSMIWFTDKFAYLWKQTELLDCLWF